ncbi:uncharacterized transporter slc-17.2 [Aplysia californica]|uniref:Uncharacterized transporter slc-17.2 n=1 Tax=Aplysia californica TaxID=6500 RepID=A0ABM0JCR8_APLCA|nr:uncharacterized transporter slc-17.2 [Aplysia californica]XP_035827902.1 uncharacterized transporter slc-17.2 [Aplysia californica]
MVLKAPLWKSARFSLAIFAFFGFLNFYALRVNMGIAIVCMVNHTAIQHVETSRLNGSKFNDALLGQGNSSSKEAVCEGEQIYSSYNDSVWRDTKEDGELLWDKAQQGLVHGSLFWGYIVTNVAGGYLATRFGGKHVIGLSLLVAAVLTLLVPTVSRTDFIGLLVLRFITGLSQGFVSPAMQSLWSHWAPPLESSRLRSISFAGSQVGKVLTYPVTALLCEYGFDGGWPSVFYVQGAFGVLWFVAWFFCVYDAPAKHPRISVAERRYIEESLKGMMPEDAKEKLKTPWMSILLSLRVWAIILSHVCSNWGEYTFLTNIPTYMKEVLHFDIKKNGFLSAVPYLCFWCVISLASCFADLVRTRGLLSTTNTRKLFNSIGMLVPAALLLGVSFVDCTRSSTAVVLLTLGVALTGFQYGGGLYMNAGDIAPKYAGVIYGISNTFATLPGFLSPLAIGYITKEQTAKEWSTVFFLSSGIYVIGALIFLLLSSGDLQPWAATTTEVTVELNNPAPVAACEKKSDHVQNGDAALVEDLVFSDVYKVDETRSLTSDISSC